MVQTQKEAHGRTS